jgi:4-aminobutyrate aminotransferase-like enzyme
MRRKNTHSGRAIPGAKSRRLAQRLRQVESRNVTYLSEEFPVFWESAQGSWVTDVDGHRFLDLTSAFGVSGLGHNAPAIRKAIQSQSKKIWHGMGDVHPNTVKVELLEALKDITPGNLSQTILSSSGAEAIESALKTARMATDKRGVIAFDGGYHGLSYATLGATDRDDFKLPFAGQTPPWITHSAYPDPLRNLTEEKCLEILEQLLRTENHPAGPFGALLVEPMQGRGGIRIPRPFFLQGLKVLARQYGLILITDEIFTGFGRTGRLFGVDHSGVTPDLMCLGKALSNGFPLSACIGTPEVMKAWPESDGEAIHTSTFLGNPLGCAMALASIREVKTKRLAQRSAKLGAAWKRKLEQALRSHPAVKDIRGSGLMIGIELTDGIAGRVVNAALQKGLIVLSGGVRRNVLTLTPPLTISERDLSQATTVLAEVFKQLPVEKQPSVEAVSV